MVSEGIVPWLKRLSVTVGTELSPETVLLVRSTGPIPRMPSTSEKPVAVEATPIDWLVMTRSGPRVTVSAYSVPLNEPEPYNGNLGACALGGAGGGVLGRRADPDIGRSGVLQGVRYDLNVEDDNLR